MTTMTRNKERLWTGQQNAIFDHILDPESGHLIVEAGAGCAKTSTIGESVWRQPEERLPRMATLAFNRHIRDEMKPILPHDVVWDQKKKEERIVNKLTVDTIHAICCKAALNTYYPQNRWKYVDADGWKYKNILRKIFDEKKIEGKDDKETWIWRYECVDLLSKCQLSLSDPDPDSLLTLQIHHGKLSTMEIGMMSEVIWAAMKQGIIDAKWRITFDDMIHLAAIGKLNLPSFQVVYIDELQDLNPAQQTVVLSLLEQGGKMIGVGDSDQCQPAGTKVMTGEDFEVNIEDLKPGDNVMTYERRSCAFYRNGKVNAVSKRPYKGQMYSVSTGFLETKATDNHKWIVRWERGDKDRWITYLMRQGDRYRVGMTQLFFNMKESNYLGCEFGLAMRARQERADAGWILKVHDSYAEALAYEQVVSAEYGLPEMVFHSQSANKHYTQDVIDSMYAQLTNQTQKAVTCLIAHGRRIEYPIYYKEDRQRQGRKTVFVTQSCNLVSGHMQVPVYDQKTLQQKKETLWNTIQVRSKKYDGDVYSLDIDNHHTYIANNIVTHNSIYGFASADVNGMENFRSSLPGVTNLELTTCYRCPTSIVALANHLVPRLRAAPGAIEGNIETFLDRTSIYSEIGWSDGDMWLCRTTAPLIEQALSLIGQDIPCTVIGRDIGTSLGEILDKIEDQEGFRFEAIPTMLIDYQSAEIEKLEEKGASKMTISSLSDRCESLILIYYRAVRAYYVNNVEGLKNYINSLFSPEQKNGVVTLCTIHRSKGLQAKNVMILEPGLLPHPKATSDWEMKQERNLEYIAITRSMENLYFVGGEYGGGK